MSSEAGAAGAPYTIGQVSDRLGIPIPTLRWWEKSGLISPAGRASGRRRYGDAEIRRLAMIQLWQTIATMSLDEIRTFLVGRADDSDWRSAVENRIGACDQQIARLTTARATLTHMLECPSDHPADNCAYLGAAIDEYLATGIMPPFSAGTG